MGPVGESLPPTPSEDTWGSHTPPTDFPGATTPQQGPDGPQGLPCHSCDWARPGANIQTHQPAATIQGAERSLGSYEGTISGENNNNTGNNSNGSLSLSPSQDQDREPGALHECFTYSILTTPQYPQPMTQLRTQAPGEVTGPGLCLAAKLGLSAIPANEDKNGFISQKEKVLGITRSSKASPRLQEDRT